MSTKEYRPTLAQLRTFVTIAEYRHFGTAAAKLQISQPSLSQALASLEHGLGMQLIERSTRKVLVTPAGEGLLPYARATLDAAHGFVTAAAGANGELAGPLVIGIIPTVAPYLLPELLQAVKTELPTLKPRVIEDQTHRLLEQLRLGRVDVVVCALPSEAVGVVDVPLYSEDFYLLVPPTHRLAGQDSASLADLGDDELLLLDEGHCLRDQTLDACRRAHAPVRSSDTRAASLTTIIQCVAEDLGVTLLPESAISVETAGTDLTAVRLDAAGPAPSRTIGLVYRSSTARSTEFAALAEVIQAAHDTVAEG